MRAQSAFDNGELLSAYFQITLVAHFVRASSRHTSLGAAGEETPHRGEEALRRMCLRLLLFLFLLFLHLLLFLQLLRFRQLLLVPTGSATAPAARLFGGRRFLLHKINKVKV